MSKQAPAAAGNGTPAPAAPAAPAATPAPEAAQGTDHLAAAVALLKETPAEDGAPPEVSKADPPKADPPADPPPPKKDDPFAARFAEFAKAQRELRVEREAFKAEQRDREEHWRRQTADFDVIRKAKESASPIQALQALGYSYEQATDEVLGKYQPKTKQPEAPKQDPELVEMKRELQQLKAERDAERERAAVASFRSAMVEKAKSGGEKYQLVDAADAYDEAVGLVVSHFQTHGELPGGTSEAAIEMALDFVERRLDGLSERVLTTSKVRSRLQPPAAPKPAAPAAGPQATTARSPSTLTNTLAAAAPPRTAQDEPKTPEDYRAAAAALLRG